MGSRIKGILKYIHVPIHVIIFLQRIAHFIETRNDYNI